jgi:hypothetical protein
MVAKVNTGDPWKEAEEKQPELMRNLNRTAARISLNGKTVKDITQLRYLLDLLRP